MTESEFEHVLHFFMALTGFDRRRINGPEESHPPVFTSDLGDTRRRPRNAPRQGRDAGTIRPIFLQPGLISQANGSAYIETQKTKIACAVYGPRQSRNTAFSEQGRLNVEVKFAPYSCRRRRAPMKDAEDRSIAVAIQQAMTSSVRLELFPKSTIDIFITIVEADGLEGCIASGSVVASTALADAGIDIYGIVASCSACNSNEEIWLDPTEDEAFASNGCLIYSCMPALDSVTSVWQSGKISPSEFMRAMDLCQEKCADIHSIVAQALLEHSRPKS